MNKRSKWAVYECASNMATAVQGLAQNPDEDARRVIRDEAAACIAAANDPRVGKGSRHLLDSIAGDGYRAIAHADWPGSTDAKARAWEIVRELGGIIRTTSATMAD